VIPLVHILHRTRGITFLAHPVHAHVHVREEKYERRRNTCTHTIVHFNFAAGAVAKYCDEHVYVCLSVRADISGTTCAIFTTSLCMLPMAVTWSSSCVFAIRYVFPVLWLTSCFNGPYSGNKRPERRSRGQFYGTETKILASRPN